MKLKKTTSAITITFFVMATTACSTNRVSQNAGSTGSDSTSDSTTSNNSGSTQVAGGGQNIGKTILEFAIGTALAKAVSD